MDPNLAVLELFLGTWDTVAPGASGSFTASWALNDQFVRTEGSLKTDDGSNDFDLISLMTFDRMSGVYRTWVFMSNGMVSESESTWDPDARTMTKVTRYGDITQTTTSDFSQDGVEAWTMVNTDGSGASMGEMSGTNTRRGE